MRYAIQDLNNNVIPCGGAHFARWAQRHPDPRIMRVNYAISRVMIADTSLNALLRHPSVMSLKSVTITQFLLCSGEGPSDSAEVTEEEVLGLGRLVRGTKVSVGDRFRARIILHRLASGKFA